MEITLKRYKTVTTTTKPLFISTQKNAFHPYNNLHSAAAAHYPHPHPHVEMKKLGLREAVISLQKWQG